MGRRSCELINRASGERILFNSLFEADGWLQRAKGYTRYNGEHGGIVRNDYNDEFDVIIYGERNKRNGKGQGKGGYFQQLCWTCRKAVCGCSWSKYGKPVDGWDAEPTVIQAGNTEKSSFKIKACPEYIADCRKRGKNR